MLADTFLREKAIEILKNKTAYAFEGGGTLGVGHIGALEQLFNLGGLRNITHVTGSSVGSIVSAALAAGASIEYMKNKLFNMDLITFQDNDNNKLRDLYQLLKYYGANKTDQIRSFIGCVLKDLQKNSEITFKELYDITHVHLTITYLSLNHVRTMYADHLTEPDTKIKDAVTKSSTIPIFYEADWSLIDSTQEESKGCCKSFKKPLYQCDIDGGTLDNFPIHVLREQGCESSKIIGFKFISKGELNKYEYTYNSKDELVSLGSPKNLVVFLERLMMIARRQAMHVYIDDDDWKLTVKTQVGDMSSTDFSMTQEQKEWLYAQGVEGMNNHLKYIMSTLETK